MTTSIVSESQVQEMADAVAELETLHKQLDPTGEFKHNVVPMSTEALQLYMRKVQEAFARHLQELREKFQMMTEIVRDEFQRLTKHSHRRTQGRVSSKGKTSAQKASSSGNGGGDGGDGDGPHRTRSKQQRRSPRNRNTFLQRPPSSSPGAFSNTSPQSPPPARSPRTDQGLIALIVVILLIFVLLLLERGERDMAWSILGPLAAALVTYIKPPGKKR